MQTLWQYSHRGARTLLKKPGFTLLVVLLLGIDRVSAQEKKKPALHLAEKLRKAAR